MVPNMGKYENKRNHRVPGKTMNSMALFVIIFLKNCPIALTLTPPRDVHEMNKRRAVNIRRPVLVHAAAASAAP
jgi:hypothetical protein